MSILRQVIRKMLEEDWSGQVPQSHHDTLIKMVEKHIDPSDPYHNPDVALFLKEVPYLGQGSSRMAYKVDVAGKEPIVFKVAKNKFGVSQNKTEAQCGMRSHPITAQVYRWHPEYLWIEEELLKPIDKSDFEAIAGLEWAEFVWGVRSAVQDEVDVTGIRFVDDVLELIQDCGLTHADLVHLEHWGVDASGRLKLMDFGFRGFTEHGKAGLGTYDADAKDPGDEILGNTKRL